MGFHIVKRDNCPIWKKCCFYLAAVVIALLLGALLLVSLGVDPVAYYTRMFTMAFHVCAPGSIPGDGVFLQSKKKK